MAWLLSNMAPDVIFSIFAYCDISSVISASQTCRYLHNLAFDKSVWLGLLDSLRHRSILDRTINLETLSVVEMIGIARGMITGPRTWTPREHDRNPIVAISKTITLHRARDVETPAVDSVKLLPSGCYVLFSTQETLECWNVAHDRLVWMHTSAVEHTTVVDFGAEETDTDSANIIICLHADLSNGPMHFIEMVHVDLRTGTYDYLLAARTPDSEPFYQPVICKALAAVRVNLGYIVINWKTRSYLIVHSPDSLPQTTLIPQHIIVLAPSVSGEHQIHLISNDTIGTYFSPTIGLEDPAEFRMVSVEELPKLHTFHASSPEQSFEDMQIHASPIRDADYRVWIWGWNHRANEHGLRSYQLSIPIDGAPKWRLRSQALLGTPLVSYSGHALCYEASRRWWTICSPGSSAPNPRLRLFRNPDFVDLATYSGAVTCPTVESTIMIRYYK
ncbi:hypothetical protein MSAN_01533900 [Mycena sanguinolenta]|uniref:F-box domain-containing protein n=1 Tax=Mycena sanguinolenta TaxID=230812 RepID=A0A8H6Y6B9_9AGAR|nr:hypothetical protein MSAN_01533900 [Mycena sanguinolenta]